MLVIFSLMLATLAYIIGANNEPDNFILLIISSMGMLLGWGSTLIERMSFLSGDDYQKMQFSILKAFQGKWEPYSQWKKILAAIFALMGLILAFGGLILGPILSPYQEPLWLMSSAAISGFIIFTRGHGYLSDSRTLNTFNVMARVMRENKIND